MIKNIWKDIILVCGCENNHSEEVRMEIQNGPSSPFYACPKYFPEKRKEGEHACGNRINLLEYEKMVEQVCNMITEELEKSIYVNLANKTWRKNGYFYKILEHREGKLKISVVNEKIILKPVGNKISIK